MLEGSPGLPGSTRALAEYRLPDDERICDLDDAGQLLALGLRPSDVVTRDYRRSRLWAKQIYELGKWSGIRWWSYYDPQWASFGLWDLGRLKLEQVSVLRLDSPALLEASRIIARPVIERRRRPL